MQWAMDFSWDQGDDWLFAVNMIGWQPTGDVYVMD